MNTKKKSHKRKSKLASDSQGTKLRKHSSEDLGRHESRDHSPCASEQQGDEEMMGGARDWSDEGEEGDEGDIGKPKRLPPPLIKCAFPLRYVCVCVWGGKLLLMIFS